jgi:fructose-1,6-bisphosphatase/inositol monophosphatase family enzyme
MLHSEPEIALERIPDPTKDLHNQPLRIDHYAEDVCRIALEKRFRSKICAVGEETLGKRPEFRDISGRQEVFAILDMIDGTDLLLRQFGNWCSAIVCYLPLEENILLSVVADSDSNVFFARAEDECAWFLSKRAESVSESVPLCLAAADRPQSREDACIRFLKVQASGPLSNESLDDASICFVGQKPPYFLAAANMSKLGERMGEYSERLRKKTSPTPAFRIYNLGGTPMMPKVANGIIDAVVGVQASKPHDVVAGAFIGLKAGAYLGGFAGREINVASLAKWLNNPSERCAPYVLACTNALYQRLVECVTPDPPAVKDRVEGSIT